MNIKYHWSMPCITMLFFNVLFWEKAKTMAQNVNIKKEQKESELLRDKDKALFMQVDKQGNPLSNFLSNFKRQFEKTEGLVS